MRTGLIGRAVAVPALTLAVLGTAYVFDTPTAAADPSGCIVKYQPDSGRRTSAYSYCATYRGEHRVKVSCSNPDGDRWTNYGPWARAGQKSTKGCYEVDKATYELR